MNEHVKNICKLLDETGKRCRYVGITKNGWSCFKADPKLKIQIDKSWATGHTAKGDNCEGVKKLHKQK